MDVDVEGRIIKASQTFGALKKPVFRDKNLTLNTKRKVEEFVGFIVNTSNHLYSLRYHGGRQPPESATV